MTNQHEIYTAAMKRHDNSRSNDTVNSKEDFPATQPSFCDELQTALIRIPGEAGLSMKATRVMLQA